MLGLVLCAALTACVVSNPGDPPVEHDWNHTHRVDLLPGWTVTARNVGPRDQSTSLSGPSGAGCLVSASLARPDPVLLPRSPHAVEVQGHPGEYGSLDEDYGPYPGAVVWQDAAGRWFRVSCDLDETGTLHIAEGVRAGTNPMRFPYKIAAIPDGVSLEQLIESTRDGRLTMTAQFEMPGPGRPLTMEISNPPEDVLQGPVELQTIAGRTVEVRTATQSICFPTQAERICVSGPGDEPASDWSEPARAVALRTAELITPVADPGDQGSWFDADVALPV